MCSDLITFVIIIKQMKELTNATLVFLIKKNKGKIINICLAMKKRGFGVNRWNGVGGKMEKNDKTIEETAKRETQEEIGVLIKNFNKVAELTFFFPHNPIWDQIVHVYFTETWDYEPKESEEMNPKWFLPSELPFDDMWPDDIYWLPEVLKGNLLKASFEFEEGDIVKKKKVDIVKEL